MNEKIVKRPSWLSWLCALPWHWIAFFGVILLVVSPIGYFWPWLKGTEETGLAESNSTTLRNAGLLVGGLIAIGLAFWRALVADRQSEAATNQAETAQKQAETSRRTLLNDSYQRAVEALGSEILPIRIGAIHALSLLAREDPEAYYRQFREVGCAFVRRPPCDKEQGTGLKGTREDVDAVMQALGSRTLEQIDKEKREKMRLPLWSVNLRNHDLHGLDLSRAMFLDAKFGYLAGAILVDTICWGADFSDAVMWGVNLSGAALYGANLVKSDLSSANLSGARLSDPHAPLEVSFEDFDLVVYKDLPRSFTRTNLTDATLFGANLENASLTGVNLAGAKFYEDVRVEDIPAHAPAYGLTQKQLDSAIADPPDRPPVLDGMPDAKTGEPLVWKTDRQSL